MTDLHGSSLQGKSIAIIAAGAPQENHGGAERFYEGLLSGFKALGCLPELIFVPAPEATTAHILENYKRAKALDLSRFDLAVSTKVPTYAVSHPHHVLYLVHTVRVFDDMFESTFTPPASIHYQERAAVHAADFAALSKVPQRFAIGYEVAHRLMRWRGLSAQVIHPPLVSNPFYSGPVGNYFFIPGRLHPWKRLDLLIQAIRRSSLPLRLLIAGTGEAQEQLRALAAGDSRIEFLGRISDAQLVELYSGALAVPFVPVREDYGYITLEAFASGKAVITCTDSGEPAHIVRHGHNGLVVAPNAGDLCTALEWAYEHPTDLEKMGQAGLAWVANLSWKKVASQLASAALDPVAQKLPVTTNVAVVDMQPIDPPIGGGRQRLLGLYHGLGIHLPTRYVGSYDWPGQSYRSHALSPTLTEIDVPLSNEHHDAAKALANKAGCGVVIDLAFSEQGALSPEYLQTVREEIAKADVVIFSHPWVYPLVCDELRIDQVVIYDAQNVEGYLRAQLLNAKNSVQAKLIRQVCADEAALGARANWILTCSHEDLQRFYRVYGFSPAKMRVAPNGVMAFTAERDITPEVKRAARENLGIAQEQMLALFIGSSYGPNVEGAYFITQELAPLLPHVQFVIAGGVCDQVLSKLDNVLLVGTISEAQKHAWLQAADVALNPMFSGSGTNIKMFDFMASSLPVITTAVGARGIESSYSKAMKIVAPTPQSFVQAIEQMNIPELRAQYGLEARCCVEEGYAWERISSQLGQFIQMRAKIAGQTLPKFSVIIPSYERPDHLVALMTQLQRQVERDFEVIIVDQSAQPWEGSKNDYGFALTYYFSPIKGAVRARNTGAMLAQGEILAFVDDDCLPQSDWLVNARDYFARTQVVGLEGKIYSDHFDDPAYRPVSNVGSEGIGFMTANLMVRSSVFQYLGGFDLQFDRPHFREDTDFGWRMLDLGEVPYAGDVAVFHPAQKREIERESFAARAHFFEKDALLCEKHPARYRILCEFERHYERTPGFAEHLVRGFALLGKAPPAWLLKKLNLSLTERE